jgi:NAD+ kinase
MAKKTQKILLVHKETKFDSTKQAIKKVEDMLKSKKLSYKKIPVSMLLKEDLLPFNLIIVLGGDGTILKTCKYVTTQEVILINSDPEHSEGVITEFPLSELEKLFWILDGKFKTKLRQRIEVKVNSASLDDPVLNEIYFGSGKSCMISEYEIQYEGKKEIQRGSGVLISTGTGSTAWYHSAGGNEFDPEEEKAKFLVREAYNKEKLNLTILNGVATGTDFKLVAKKEDMVLSIDSYSLHPLKCEDKVTFKISKFPLKVLCPLE